MMYRYFPSCNYTGVSKINSEKIQEYLRKQEDVEVMGCCRVGHQLLTKEDIALTVCQTCSAIIREDSVASEMSIFEYILTKEDFPYPDYHGQQMYLVDCFKARNKRNALNAIREVMKKMNIKVIEIDNNYEKADYCGTFYYNPMRPANMELAPITFIEEANMKIELLSLEEQKERMIEYVKQFESDIPIVAYCNSCLRGLKLVNANGIHLMDLLVKIL